MKKILLMRHAKSGWDNPRIKDFDRPLTERGIEDASAMGSFIKRAGYVPELVISSPAERAKITSTIVIKNALLNEEILSWNPDFYYGSEKDYLKVIRDTPSQHDTILLVGHNPNMEAIAGILAGANKMVHVKMPSGALICLESLYGTWQDVTAGSCQIKWMMIPEVLRNHENEEAVK